MFNTSHYNYHIVPLDSADEDYPVMSFVSLPDAVETFNMLRLHSMYAIKSNKGLDMTPMP